MDRSEFLEFYLANCHMIVTATGQIRSIRREPLPAIKSSTRLCPIQEVSRLKGGPTELHQAIEYLKLMPGLAPDIIHGADNPKHKLNRILIQATV